MKLLIRCKLAFGSRNELVTMFQYLTEYDEAMEKMRAIVETKETYRVNQDDLQEIQKLTKEVTETAAKVMDGAPRFPARVTPVEDAASKNWKGATTHTHDRCGSTSAHNGTGNFM